MNTVFDFSKFEQGRTVYIRPVQLADLPEDMRDQVGTAKTLYAVHAADGERLAVVKDRSLAFILARQNDMSPVTVH
ncbi:DUF1150 family protein [Roseivivax sp. CAU 1753]